MNCGTPKWFNTLTYAEQRAHVAYNFDRRPNDTEEARKDRMFRRIMDGPRIQAASTDSAASGKRE